jgi:hypothetical protein
MHTAAIVFLCIILLDIIVVSLKHGQSREYNIVHYLFGAAITCALLFWGGFFDSPNTAASDALASGRFATVTNSSVFCVVALPTNGTEPASTCRPK